MAGWSMGGFLTVNYALEKPERLNKIVLLAPAATFVPFSNEYHFKAALSLQVPAMASAVYDAKLAASYMIGGYLGGYNISREELEEGIKDTDLAKLVSDFEEGSLKELEERIDSVLKSSWQLMYVPGNLDDEVLESLVQMSLLRMKTQNPPYLWLWRMGPHALPEEDIKKLKTPTLLLIGDHEFIYEVSPEQTLKRAEELVENIQTELIPNCSHALVYEQPELVSSHMLDFLSGDK